MIKELLIRNFRSIPRVDMEIAPINVLTGTNNSGKSSIMYALLTLRNIASIPNQPVDSFFTYGFLNLGGFKETVHMKKEAERITVGISCSIDQVDCYYGVSLGKKGSSFNIHTYRPYELKLEHQVTFPYPANTVSGIEIHEEFGSAKISWNGLTPTIALQELKDETVDQETITNKIAQSFSLPIEELRSIDFVPLKRGFTKPVYSAVPIQPQLLTDDEIATAVATDPDLEGKVNHYLERIVNKNFSAKAILQTANFRLLAQDRSTGLVCDLVNEGFGTNQLVYLLVKVLSKDREIICIEEPEIHLHPEAIVSLAQAMCQLAKAERKRFIISTHSEHFISALLNAVANKKIEVSDVNIYHLSKTQSITTIERQTIKENGQIEGGLKGFYETELRLSKEFLHTT